MQLDNRAALVAQVRKDAREKRALRVTKWEARSFVEKQKNEDEVFPMDPIRSIKLRWLHGALHDVTYELTRSQFSQFAPHAWEPDINAYSCEKCIRICVDLAGVDRSQIDLTVEPRRILIRGARQLPEPTHEEGRAVGLLAMEIGIGQSETLVAALAQKNYRDICTEKDYSGVIRFLIARYG